MGTFQRAVAAHAGGGGGIAPAVDEKDALLAATKVLHQLLAQLLAQGLGGHGALPQVKDGDLRQGNAAVALGEPGQQVFPLLGAVGAFDAGGGGGQNA